MATTLSALRILAAAIMAVGVARGFALKKCQDGIVEQEWQLSPGVKPGDSAVTNLKMAAPKGGCWEIEACDTKAGAAVNCNWGCKGLPKFCKSPCDCNGAWSLNPNGTITSVMDGACLTNSGGETVVVSPCTGKPSQVFALKPRGESTWAVTHGDGGNCIQGSPAPAPPPPPCTTLQNQTACVAALDKEQHRRCTWNATAGRCSVPPPPPPPQLCNDITIQADCRWSEGRDCVWSGDKCQPPPPPAPLPACAVDHTCAHNGLSDTPPCVGLPVLGLLAAALGLARPTA
jgi:hypothetical protein